jgi:heavy metal sensor kinase
LYTAILAVTFAIVGVGLWVAMRDSINDTVDKDLRGRLAAMRDYLQKETQEHGAALNDLAEDAAMTPAGARFRVGDASGRWLYQAPGTEKWSGPPADPASLPKRGRSETFGPWRKQVRVLTAWAAPFVVQIGTPLDEFTEMLDGFTWTALLSSPLLLIVAAMGGYWMSRRALAPVEEIARTAGEIEAQNLSARLPLRGTGDELDHLSATLNAMFKRLEDGFSRITRFTADASHELRTPVAIIRTTAEVTRARRRSEREYTEALDRILAESERTTALIEDLLLLARADDANGEQMAREPVELAAVCRAVCADARMLAEASGVCLREDGFAECTVLGDDRSLRRLLLILLDNAMKYSKPGGAASLQLSVCGKAEQARAVIEVRDNGIGIAAEDLPHVFERFYRASKDRSRKVDGVGLGLSIAQLIVERHGGEIQVESELSYGSTVRVSLPAA